MGQKLLLLPKVASCFSQKKGQMWHFFLVFSSTFQPFVFSNSSIFQHFLAFSIIFQHFLSFSSLYLSLNGPKVKITFRLNIANMGQKLPLRLLGKWPKSCLKKRAKSSIFSSIFQHFFKQFQHFLAFLTFPSNFLSLNGLKVEVTFRLNIAKMGQMMPLVLL